MDEIITFFSAIFTYHNEMHVCQNGIIGMGIGFFLKSLYWLCKKKKEEKNEKNMSMP